jgi:hypothetical protein
MRSCATFLTVGASFASAGWPIAYEDNQDTLPSVDVRLTSPRHPYPEVASEIASLEKTRRTSESRAVASLDAAFTSGLHKISQVILIHAYIFLQLELSSAKSRITSTISSFMKAFDGM